MLEDRILQAISLYNNNVSTKIIMSGDHGKQDYDEVNIMKQFAIEKGVPSEDIFMDHAGFSSYESIYRAKDILAFMDRGYDYYEACHLTRQRMSASHKGIKQSDEWINKRKRVGEQNGMYGRTLSKESKELISKKTKGGNNPSAKRCFLFSNIDDLKEYECLSYAYKTINMGIKYCRNHRLSGIYEKETGRIVFILTEVEFAEFNKWLEENDKELDWTNIQQRYDLYNEYFYSKV